MCLSNTPPRFAAIRQVREPAGHFCAAYVGVPARRVNSGGSQAKPGGIRCPRLFRAHVGSQAFETGRASLLHELEEEFTFLINWHPKHLQSLRCL